MRWGDGGGGGVAIIGEEPKGAKTQQFTQHPADSITGRYYWEKSDLR